MFKKKLLLATALLLSLGYGSSAQCITGFTLPDFEPLIKFGMGFMVGVTSPISWLGFLSPQNKQECFDDNGNLSRSFCAGAIAGITTLGLMIYKLKLQQKS